MDIFLALSSICIISSMFFFSHVFQESLAQLSKGLTKKTVTVKEIFQVGITIFSVTNETGQVLSFVNVNDVASGRYFNAPKDDMNNHDGIVESVISFPNKTVATGANFTACNVVLKDNSMLCKSGLNVPQRTEVIQFVLPTFKQMVK
jgi:hypothetical protein